MKYENYKEAAVGENGLAVIGVFLKVTSAGRDSPAENGCVWSSRMAFCRGGDMEGFCDNPTLTPQNNSLVSKPLKRTLRKCDRDAEG